MVFDIIVIPFSIPVLSHQRQVKWTYRSGLRLSNQIPSKHSRLDRSLLDSRRLLETVRVDTTKQLFGEFHRIESFDRLIPIGIKVGIS
jgi:hypothetical protein